MRWARWIDHLPLWVALGATMSTGIYEPGELVVMALPLVAAAGVEILRWDLGRHHRWLEVGALVSSWRTSPGATASSRWPSTPSSCWRD